jgi:hypothetical protein
MQTDKTTEVQQVRIIQRRTMVTNIRNDQCDVYIGRPSPFGNPFQIGKHGDRTTVIQKYREWFYKKLNDTEFSCKVNSLRGKRLGCWCAPDPCHGDIIVEYLEGKQNEKPGNTPSVTLETFCGDAETEGI